MSTYHTARKNVAALAAVTALAACSGGAQVPGNSGAFVPATQRAGAAALQPTPGSWMSPEAAQFKRLLYVSYGRMGSVLVYNYDTGKQVGELTGFHNPGGQCVDAMGNVYIADSGRNELIEYPRAGIVSTKTLGTPGHPIGCSIAPNGNVASANYPDVTGDVPPNITVWPSLGSNPVVQSAHGCKAFGSPGYDAHSHLYVGCNRGGELWAVYELSNAGGKLAQVTVSGGGLGFASSVMWDGKYLAFTTADVSLRAQSYIVRAVTSAPGTLQIASATKLGDRCPGGTLVEQPFIVGNVNTPANHEQGTAVVGADYLCGNVFQWAYPAGAMTKLLISAPAHITGASVSIATIPPPGK